jgi:hypothetical protein
VLSYLLLRLLPHYLLFFLYLSYQPTLAASEVCLRFDRQSCKLIQIFCTRYPDGELLELFLKLMVLYLKLRQLLWSCFVPLAKRPAPENLLLKPMEPFF